MDVFHMDSTSISSSMMDAEGSAGDETNEVKFEAHSEFDLNFFDTPDDSTTHGGYSPHSVESSTSLAATPEPHMPSTPIAISNHAQQSITSSSSVTINQLHHNVACNPPPSLVNVKNGKT